MISHNFFYNNYYFSYRFLKELDILKGYDIDQFDEHFLKSCSPFLSNLVEIKKEKIKLKNLLAISHFKYRDLILQKIFL